MATPMMKNPNMKIGTHRELCFTETGTGGVYRDGRLAWLEPLFVRLRRFFSSTTSLRIGRVGRA